VADPAALAARLDEATRGVGDAMPDVATHVVATGARAAGYLADTLPPGSIEPGTMGAPPTRPSERVSQELQRRWLARVEVVDDPLLALDAIAGGVVTDEHVDALRTVYPALYQSLTSRVVDEVAGGEPLPYASRVTLSIAFGLPADRSLEPAAIAAAQAGYGPPSEPPGGPLVSPSSARPVTLSRDVATTYQRMESV
jgi:hypothetical protein